MGERQVTVAELIAQLHNFPEHFTVETYGVVGPTPSDWGYLEVEDVRMVPGETVIIE